MPNSTVSLVVIQVPGKAKKFPPIPWYPGMLVLDAMLLCQAMNAGRFEFQIEYNSLYGAFVNKIDNVADAGNTYWLVFLNGSISKYGISEAVIIEDPQAGTNFEICWRYEDITQHAASLQITRKTAARSS